jgi:phage portal protein BeeE
MGFMDHYRAWRDERAINKLERRIESAPAPAAAPVAVVAPTPDVMRTSPAETAGAGLQSDIAALVLNNGLIPSVILSGDSVEQVYEAATWSFAAMSANAEAVASMPIVVETQKPGEDWQIDREHELNAFVEEPLGPGQRPSWDLNQYLEMVCLQKYIVGDSFARILSFQRGKMPALDPWHPSDVTVWDDGRRVAFYQHIPRPRGQFTGKTQPSLGRIQNWGPKDVFHCMFGSPTSLIRGSSILRVALRAMEIDRTAQERVRANLLNKLGIGVVLQHAPGQTGGLSALSTKGMSEAQETDAKTQLREEFQAAQRDGEVFVMGGSTSLIKPPNTIDQLNYDGVRGQALREILAIFRTPPQLLGILENSTLQNSANSVRLWWGNAVSPMLLNILKTLNAQVVRRFFPSTSALKVRLGFSVGNSPIGLEILKSRAETAQVIVGLGFSANDGARRVELGMPDRPELDQTNMPAVVAGHAVDVGAGEAPSEEPEAEPENAAEPEPAAEPDDG